MEDWVCDFGPFFSFAGVAGFSRSNSYAARGVCMLRSSSRSLATWRGAWHGNVKHSIHQGLVSLHSCWPDAFQCQSATLGLDAPVHTKLWSDQLSTPVAAGFNCSCPADSTLHKGCHASISCVQSLQTPGITGHARSPIRVCIIVPSALHCMLIELTVDRL